MSDDAQPPMPPSQPPPAAGGPGYPPYPGGPAGVPPGGPGHPPAQGWPAHQGFPPSGAPVHGGHGPPFGPGGPYGPGGPGMPGGSPPPPKKRTGLWIGLGVGAVALVLVIVGGIALVALNGSEEPADRGEPQAADGSDGRGEPTGGAAAEETEPTKDDRDGDDFARYTGPSTPTKVDIGSGPYKRPGAHDVCSAFTDETLDGLGIEEDDGFNENESITSCIWSRLADDGSFHTLDVEYSVPPDNETSVSQAKSIYKFSAERGIGIIGERVKEKKVDIGDESLVVLTNMPGSSAHEEATVIVRVENMIVEIRRGIRLSSDEPNDASVMDWDDVQKLMPELARQAVNHLD
ncbi:hypothetical protein GCM10009800_43980 [Nocardiopsis rhodophaea]